jgi:CheY-like chemotaxis protein
MNQSSDGRDASTRLYSGRGDISTSSSSLVATLAGLPEVYTASTSATTLVMQPGALTLDAEKGMRGKAMPQTTIWDAPAPGRTGVMPQTTNAVTAQPLVLVVDDEPNIIEFLRYALEDSGYRVATARDGLDALAEVRRERPSFVLTDLMMPRLDGWELCRRLREDSAMQGVPLLAMSAVANRGVDVDAFLPKPFDMDDLLSALQRCATSSPAER